MDSVPERARRIYVGDARPELEPELTFAGRSSLGFSFLDKRIACLPEFRLRGRSLFHRLRRPTGARLLEVDDRDLRRRFGFRQAGRLRLERFEQIGIRLVRETAALVHAAP